VTVRAVTDNAVTTYDTAVTSGTAILVAPEAGGVTPLPPAASTYLVAYSNVDRTADVTIYEERYFNLKDIMNVSFADLDGSEVRSITIGNPVGSGGTIRIDSGSGFVDVAVGTTVTINARTRITINALDTDSDGAICGVPIAEADLTDNSVILNLHIPPRAGDVVAGNLATVEDTAVAFLQHVAVTDTTPAALATGPGERIDTVSFTVPTGWKVIAPDPSVGWSTTGDGITGTYTITFTAGVLTEAQREAVLDSFLIQPPAHSSKDLPASGLQVAITTTDTNTVNSISVSDTATKTIGIGITVTPAAEVLNQVIGQPPIPTVPLRMPMKTVTERLT